MDTDLDRQAAFFAVDTYIKDGMLLGIGDDACTAYVVDRLSEHLRIGRLRDVSVIATSANIDGLLQDRGIPTSTLQHTPHPDLYFASPDQMDRDLNFILVARGSVLRHKILARASHGVIIVTSENRQSELVGIGVPVPVEVVPFGGSIYVDWLSRLGCKPNLRLNPGGDPFINDDGNYVYDCLFSHGIEYRTALDIEDRIRDFPGAVEHGLFRNAGYLYKAVVATRGDGLQELEVHVD